jgi:hypothetical protein
VGRALVDGLTIFSHRSAERRGIRDLMNEERDYEERCEKDDGEKKGD